MDKILLHDLAVWCRVGVTDAERAQPQRLLLCVAFDQDVSIAARTGALSDTIDYYAVAQRLLHFGEGRSWQLIETLAVDIAEELLRQFAPRAVTVEVKKMVIPEASYVAVRVTRGTADQV